MFWFDVACLNMGPSWSVLEGCGILRRQRLNGESESLGTEVLRVYYLALLPVLLFPVDAGLSPPDPDTGQSLPHLPTTKDCIP